MRKVMCCLASVIAAVMLIGFSMTNVQADPGMCYQQEYYEGEAEDVGNVICGRAMDSQVFD